MSKKETEGSDKSKPCRTIVFSHSERVKKVVLDLLPAQSEVRLIQIPDLNQIITVIEEFKPHIIVTDLHFKSLSPVSIPHSEGIALIRKLKGDNRTNHIPVVVLSSLISPEEDSLCPTDAEARECFKAGAVRVFSVVKPPSPAQFVSLIDISE